MIGKLLRVEAIKLRSRSAFTLTVLILVLFLVLMLGGIVYTSTRTGTKVPIPRFWNEMHQMVSQLVMFCGLITVVNLTAAEYGWRTSRQNVIDGLSREEWFTAKVLVWILVVLFFWTIAWGLTFTVGAIFGDHSGQFITGGQLKGVVALLLSCLGFAGMGLFSSFLTRNTAGAIALVLGWMTIGEGLVQAMLFRAGREYMKYAEYLPSQTFGRVGEMRRWAGDMAPRGRAISLTNDFLSNEVTLLLAAGYIALFLGASFALVRRQDL